MRRFTPLLPLAALMWSCSDKGGADTGALEPFCETFRDADSHLIEGGDATGESGEVVGRLITDESDDLHDPQFVGFVEYTMENLDVGGVQQQGETDQDGGFTKTVGEGHWRIKLSGSKSGYECSNEYEFVVEATQRTRLCVDVGCVSSR